ncbi:MAG: TIGR00725 family protein [Gemmatimonadetes bacterium]|nr:TIGR00725 family protein [Gemmatimonadota bacterium]
MLISVVGSSDASPEAEALAEAVGRGLAERGALLVCGGLRGVMAAACRGAKAAGGTTIGILPGDDPAAANPWVDIAIPTGLGYARNALVVKAGAAVIAVCGSFGTLSEIGHALADGKAVFGLRTWELSREDGGTGETTVRAQSPEDAVEKALAAARAGATGPD